MFNWTYLWILATLCSPALAKDVNNLTPEPVPTPDESAEPATPGAAEKGTPADATQKVDPRQNTPAWAKDRLYLETSFGLAKASASKGKLNSLGMSDITIGYGIPRISLPRNGRASAYFRYAPLYVQGSADTSPFKGVVESYGLGANARFPILGKWTALGAAELALVDVSLKNQDYTSRTPPIKSGAGIGFGGGADYWVQDLFSVGPRLFVSLGSVRVIQLSAGGSFVF